MFTEEAQYYLKFLLAEDAEIDFKIQHGTEMYRKGFGRFTLRDAEGNELPAAEIKLKQKSHEYKFGCNAFMIDSFPEAEQNQRYEEIFASLFNMAVVPFYWSDLEPEPGKLRFTKDSPFIYRRPAPDRVVEFCQEHDIMPKGHPLCWHNFAPAWLPKNSRDVMKALEKRFREIAERYAGIIPVWDVVNEAQTRHPGIRKSSPMFPDDYVSRCFELAERYFPYNQKVYNEDRMWWDFQGDNTHTYLAVKNLLDNGRKVDSLGLQYHMFTFMIKDTCLGVNRPLSPQVLWRIFDQYAKLNIPLSISEVTLLSHSDLGDGEAFQALALERLYRLWFSHPATESIVWWNLVDGTASAAGLGCDLGQNKIRPGLINYDFTEKPAGKVLRQLIREEWHTETAIKYTMGADNCFHGFYGKYDAEIITGKGKFVREIDLSKYSYNQYEITVE